MNCSRLTRTTLAGGAGFFGPASLAFLFALVWIAPVVAQDSLTDWYNDHHAKRGAVERVESMAAVITSWTNGAGDGDLATATNWSDGVPDGGGDDVVRFPAGVGGAIISNMDQMGRVAEMVVESGNTTRFGSDGNPLQMSAGLLRHSGSGDLYWEETTAVSTSIIIDANPNATIKLDSTVAAAATEIYILGGVTTTTADFYATYVNVNDSQYGNGSGHLTIADGSGLPASGYLGVGGNGYCSISAPVLRFEQTGGLVDVRNYTSGTAIQSWRISGGVCRHNYRGAGAFSTCVVEGSGVLDFRGNSSVVDVAAYVGILRGGRVYAYQGQLDYDPGDLLAAGGALIIGN